MDTPYTMDRVPTLKELKSGKRIRILLRRGYDVLELKKSDGSAIVFRRPAPSNRRAEHRVLEV